MRKGCTVLQNVRCLKWCRYYDIGASWNLIWGFPGETTADYDAQLNVLQSISHLEPPRGCGRIWLERFSPYYTDRTTFPVRNVRPEASYQYVYPPHVNLERAAYFFDYEMDDTVGREVHRATSEYVAQWQAHWNSPNRHSLTYRRTGDGLLIDFARGSEEAGTYSLFGPLALVYEACVETMHTVDYVIQVLRNTFPEEEFDVDEIREVLDEFCRARLMLSEDGHYLSLALPSNPTW
jgi:hypothetical protein